jgi:hypothetical protein
MVLMKWMPAMVFASDRERPTGASSGDQSKSVWNEQKVCYKSDKQITKNDKKKHSRDIRF